MIKFSVPGTPIPQARPRFTRTGHVYEPPKCKAYKAIVAAAARAAMRGKKPISGPVYVHCKFFFAVQKSWPRDKREDAIYGDFPMIRKPDGDNLEKIVWDALTGIVWKDDAQVNVWTGEKRFGDEPRLVVTVSEYP